MSGPHWALTILGHQSKGVLDFPMEITKITSHILQYELPEVLGYSQQFYQNRTAHLVEVETDEGITGWGECFGPGNIALANRAIVER
jgi:D-galactarolactone cycloisomerase